MAAIDKTYLNDWDQFDAARNWAKQTYIPLKNGKRVCMANFMYEPDLTKEEWERRENKTVVLWNTPVYADVFLIRNCPFDFIHDRLKEQYGGGWSKTALAAHNNDNEYERIKSGTSDYDTYQRNGLGKNAKVKFGKHAFRFVPRDKNNWWWIEIKQCGWWYNEEDDAWYNWMELMPISSNVAHRRGALTKKNIVNLVKKWDLPKGTELRFACLLNRYEESFTVRVK